MRGYYSFLENVPFPAVISTLDNHALLSVNQWASELMQVPPDKKAGKKYSDWFEIPDEYTRLVKEIRRFGQVKDREASLKTFNGESLPVLISANSFVVDDKKVALSAFKDLSFLKKMDEELRIKSLRLDEVNTALKVLLRQRDLDKTELEEKVLRNVKELIFPYVDKLKSMQSSKEQRTYLDVLETNLNDIVSPFIQKLTSLSYNLTPAEIRVAHFIREGKTVKEISKVLAVSESAINIHRQHIRNKLGLNRKKVSLGSYLVSLQ